MHPSQCTLVDGVSSVQVHEFFSYEHFYVIYCKFWELDSDHDFLLSREDMLRYDNGALSPLIIDRVMNGQSACTHTLAVSVPACLITLD